MPPAAGPQPQTPQTCTHGTSPVQRQEISIENIDPERLASKLHDLFGGQPEVYVMTSPSRPQDAPGPTTDRQIVR